MIFMSSRMTNGEEALPLAPHHHFHPFHLVGQADPKACGRENKTISRVPGMVSYKSIWNNINQIYMWKLGTRGGGGGQENKTYLR